MMKYYLCEHCHCTNEVNNPFKVIHKCPQCKEVLGSIRLYKKREDLKYTEEDNRKEFQYMRYFYGLLLIALVITRIVKG